MKNVIKVITSTLLLIHCAACATVNADAIRVRRQIDHLISSCRNYDYPTASKSILYRGEEKDRNWRKVLNAKSYKDKLQAVEVCEKVRRINQDSNFRQWSTYNFRKDPNGEWHDQTIDFLSTDGWHKFTFSLKRMGEYYALGDITQGVPEY